MRRRWLRVTSPERDADRTFAALRETFPKMRIAERVQAAGRLSAGLPVVLRPREVGAPGALVIEPADGPLAELSLPPHPTFESAWIGLKALLHPAVPDAYACLEGPAYAEDVARVEAQLGRALPWEYKSLLCMHNGQRADGPLPWEMAPLHERLMTWHWLNRSGHPEEWWSPDWFPILSNGSGDYLFLDLSLEESPLLCYRHDEEERPVLASSLSGWILELHEQLCTGRLFAKTSNGRFAGLIEGPLGQDTREVIRFDYS